MTLRDENVVDLHGGQIAAARARLDEVEALAVQVYGKDGWAAAQHAHAEAIRNDPEAREAVRATLTEMLSPVLTGAVLTAAVDRMLRPEEAHDA